MLAALSVELIHQICRYLDVPTVLSLRRTCAFLHDATELKILWIQLLQKYRKSIPLHVPDYRLLEPPLLEAMVRRLARVSEKYAGRDVKLVASPTIFFPQSITWIRLVDARWLFVTFSDDATSKIGLWDLFWMFQGYTGPITETTLPEAVQSAQLQVQSAGVVVVLGFESAILVLTVQHREDKYEFCELSRIEGSSQAMSLAGSFVGCAILQGMHAPHLVRWTDGRVFELEPPPGGLETPERRCLPQLMAIWNQNLAIVRVTAIEIYTFSALDEPPVFSHTVLTPHTLLLYTTTGLHRFTLRHDTAASVEGSNRTLLCVAASPQCTCSTPDACNDPQHAAKWYRFCSAPSAQRCIWISADSEGGITSPFSAPRLLLGELSPAHQPTSPLPPRTVSLLDRYPGGPALWAFPKIDFDDAIGIIVMGNCFGELAVYDLDSESSKCFDLARNIFRDGSERPLPLLPPPPPNSRCIMGPTVNMSPLQVEACTTEWSRDDLQLSPIWRTDWSTRSGYTHAHQWGGRPGDYAWILANVYGWPGRVVPQAFLNVDGYQRLFFRVGNRYFDARDAEENEFATWPPSYRGERHPSGFVQFHSNRASKLICTRRAAVPELLAYRFGLSEDEPRDRWLEMQERGGCVDLATVRTWRSYSIHF
ncbi:F-box domain-containing protein [Mycena kentingensis (nom. inval.)]|nr:F-box domain-containing protein [Mycena kentingensis (nom. inval.)]